MKISLRIKLLSLVVISIALISTILVTQSIVREREVFQESFKDKAKILALSFDASIGNLEELRNFSKLQSLIYKFLWLHPEIVKISIGLPSEEGIKIVASNKSEEIGKNFPKEFFDIYQKGGILPENLVLPDGTKLFGLVTPVHVGGQRMGIYEIVLSKEAEEKAILRRQKEIAFTISLSLLFLIVLLYFFLHRMVISPILEIKKGMEIFKKGNLSFRLVPKSKDEIGDLAEGFNQMAEKFEESCRGLEEKVKKATEELEEAKTALEIKVAARTKELRDLAESLEEKVKERTKELEKKILELEKFQRLAVGRELRIIELKKEIERLKKELENKKWKKEL
jgi:HAMP domain-containing protein